MSRTRLRKRASAPASKLPIVLPRNSTNRCSPALRRFATSVRPERYSLSTPTMLTESMLVAEFGLARRERGARNLDRIVRERAAAAQRAQGIARVLRPLPLPSSSHHRLVRREPRYLGRMTLQQALVGSRQPVLGQQCDRLEQHRAERIVEILRRKLLLSGLAEPGANVLRELVQAVDDRGSEYGHDALLCERAGELSTQRKPA